MLSTGSIGILSSNDMPQRISSRGRSSSQILDEFSLRIRAQYRCEYCQKELQDQLYEIDHIIPLSLGGSNTAENLAMSCARCNRNKGSRTVFVDPISRRTYSLFNPRRHRWRNHFKRVGSEIVGTTPRGSATAALLFQITPRYNPPDLFWDKLQGLERSERLYRFLNDLRFRRLNNQFKELAVGLTVDLPNAKNPKELAIARASKLLLRLELLFTRSTGKDIAEGIKLAEKNLQHMPRRLQKELRLILSILYQQRAALRYGKGNLKGAVDDQNKSDNYFSIDHPDSESIRSQEGLRNMLRKMAVQTKFQSVDFPQVLLRNLLRASIDLNDQNDFRHFTYMTDAALNAETFDIKTLEALYAALTRILDDSGYGQTIDKARFVTLRRRWWFLHLMFEAEPWIDALISDLAYWRQIRMFNEIREFRLGLSKYVRKLNPDSADLAEREINAIDR